MNRTFTIWTALLVALLLHVTFFSLTTIVFPIDSAEFKPKFFFLGPILSKNDVKGSPPYNSKPNPNSTSKSKSMFSTANTLDSLSSDITDRAKNPFAIRTIKKPLMLQSKDSQNKISIKSTFENSFEIETDNEADKQESLRSELKIPSYKPLRFRAPQR